MRSEALIRRAQPDEVEVLNTLIMLSKSHWGYDQSFLEAWRPHLILTCEAIERNYVYCAEARGTIAGLSHFAVVSDAEIYLDHLFIEPAFIGQGIGGLLWRHAVEQARAMGAKALVFEADPYARPS